MTKQEREELRRNAELGIVPTTAGTMFRLLDALDEAERKLAQVTAERDILEEALAAARKDHGEQ